VHIGDITFQDETTKSAIGTFQISGHTDDYDSPHAPGSRGRPARYSVHCGPRGTRRHGCRPIHPGRTRHRCCNPPARRALPRGPTSSDRGRTQTPWWHVSNPWSPTTGRMSAGSSKTTRQAPRITSSSGTGSTPGRKSCWSPTWPSYPSRLRAVACRSDFSTELETMADAFNGK
jgi:hypothetical protein